MEKLTIKEQVQKDLVQAMKDKSILKGIIVLLKSDLDEQERVFKLLRQEVSDADKYKIINKHIKNAKELISYAEKSNQQKTIQEEKQKIEYLTSLLCPQQSEEELEEAVKKLIQENEDLVMGKMIGLAVATIKNSAPADIAQAVRKAMQKES